MLSTPKHVLYYYRLGHYKPIGLRRDWWMMTYIFLDMLTRRIHCIGGPFRTRRKSYTFYLLHAASWIVMLPCGSRCWRFQFVKRFPEVQRSAPSAHPAVAVWSSSLALKVVSLTRPWSSACSDGPRPWFSACWPEEEWRSTFPVCPPLPVPLPIHIWSISTVCTVKTKATKSAGTVQTSAETDDATWRMTLTLFEIRNIDSDHLIAWPPSKV